MKAEKKEKNVVIAGTQIRVNYPLKGEHKEKKWIKRKQHQRFKWCTTFFFLSHLTFHLQAVMNCLVMLNQCSRSELLVLG